MSYTQSQAFLSSLIYDGSRVNEAAVNANARYIDSSERGQAQLIFLGAL